MDKKNIKQLKEQIYFRLERKNCIWATGLAVFLSALVLINRHLFTGIKADGSRYQYNDLIFLFGFTALIAILFSLVALDIGQRLRHILSWILFLGFAPFCAYCVEWMNQTNLAEKGFFNPPYRWTANILIYLMLLLLLYAVTRRFFLAALLGCSVSLFFGAANYFVTQFRGTPILPWDLTAVGTAAGVASGYEIRPTSQILYTIFSSVLLLTLLHKLQPDSREDCKKLRILERLCPLAVSLGLMIAILPLDVLSALDISVYPWNQKSSTKMTGVAAGFFGNLQFMMVDKPEGYSIEAIKDIQTQTQDLPVLETVAKTEKKPTVIAIMNESFTDLETVGNGSITLSQDNMPYIHSLMEGDSTISGVAYSSVTGGSTCDSEFEFLTGDSKAFLPVGSKPYQQYVEDGQLSLVSTLQAQGYETLAIHPGQLTAWNRDTAYPALGFGEFVYAHNFLTNRQFVRQLTSDRSCYDELIYRYEQHTKASNDPLFVFNVTIQNHGGFDVEGYESTVEVQSEPGKYPSVEQYLSLIKESDEDFEYLIDYFEKQEEPVVILMFGDHWPVLEDAFLETLLGTTDLDSLSIEETMRAYQVPYLVWANYPLDDSGVNMETTSLNYLHSLLLRCAGLELTDYNKYLVNLHDTIPVITEIGMIDANGNTYKHTDETPFSNLLNAYSILQYNQIFDKKNLVSSLFMPQDES